MLRVFISFHANYGRREAEDIKDAILGAFKIAEVFVSTDIQSKYAGRDWQRELGRILHSCNLFIAIIDPQWELLILRPDSVVRREIESALWNPRMVAHIPIRIGNANIPDRASLPESIKKFLDVEFFQDLPEAMSEAAGQEVKVGNAYFEYQKQALLRQLHAHVTKIMEKETFHLAFVSQALSLRNSDDSLAFFSLMTTEVVNQAQREGRFKLEVVLKIPELEQFSKTASEQQKILQAVLDHHRNYSAILICPFNVADLKSRLEKFRRDNPHYPIYTIDQCFQKPWITDGSQQHNTLPKGVLCNWAEAGEIAATHLYDYLAMAKVSKPSIWILLGNFGMEDREHYFEKKLKELTNSCAILKLNGQFQQEFAKQQILDAHSKHNYLPHAVFCTNDEMALGVHDALTDIESRNKGSTFGIKIIGFDGIHDITTHLGKRDDVQPKRATYYLNTIDVHIRAQVIQVMQLVVEHLTDPSYREPETAKLVEPHAYLNLHIQRRRVEAQLLEWHSSHAEQLQQYRAERRSPDKNFVTT